MRSNKASISMQDILEIENDEEILRFRCPETGYLLWPLIRNDLIRFIMSDLFFEIPLRTEHRTPRSRKTYFSLLKAFAYNALKGRAMKGPILISATGSHVLRNGQYFNRLADHFALAAIDQTVILETLFTDWQWPFPRHNERVLIDGPIGALSSLYGKLSVKQKHAKIAEALVQFVAQRAHILLDWTLSEGKTVYLTTVLAKHMASIPLRRIFYTRLFRRTGTQILIRQLGCYGGSSIINRVAHDCGIVSAEYQHGSVSAGHDAYNFADTLCKSEEYKKTLPQFFLGYGKWWTDQINAPIIKINIGNPHRTETLKSTFAQPQRKTDLLVLGDGINTEKYLSVCSTLANKLGATHRLVFRPHPLERERVLCIHGQKQGDVYIEWDKGIIDALQTADIVISEVSTGLFEAVGLANRVFMWDSPRARLAYPAHPFATFSNTDDLVAKIQDGVIGMVDTTIAEELWEPNWKKNYLDFLQRTCPGVLDSQAI